MKLVLLSVLFLLGLAIAIFPAEHSYAKPTIGNTQDRYKANVAQKVRKLATCLSYFELALNSHRRDPRLSPGNLFEAQKSLFKAIKTIISYGGISAKQYREIKSDIDEAMYLQIDRETRKIGILVEEHDAICQAVVRRIDQVYKRLKK